jgi:carbamoyl-phosphate synthase large subunit
LPRRTDIHSILLIGSGPIVIGQACEFDYSGVQAVKALKEEGFRVVLVNSNPATIMTDPELADRTYIEPITASTVEKIIKRERPDALLPTMGGQTALNVTMEVGQGGVLDRFGVRLIGANLDAIDKAENRERFKEAMERIGLDVPRGGFAHSMEEARTISADIRFPLIIRPSFTLGGGGGSIVYDEASFKEAAEAGLRASPTTEILIEESVRGWKEYELEVMRDLKDNVVIICSIENVDPMGVHTGDSITVAPAQTLSDREYQAMRDAAIRIIREIGVDTGGSNIQFAVDPKSGRMVVIEANPRVSRSSALASKATGFPIARIAAKLAVGYTLDEIPNAITKKTPASFEPTIDYCGVKVPRWAFEKFPGVDTRLGTQMKSVGEAMAIGRSFREALQKALQSLEKGRDGWGADGKESPLPSDEEERARRLAEAIDRLGEFREDSVLQLREAMRLGASAEELHERTRIDPWFLDQLFRLMELEEEIRAVGSLGDLQRDLLYRAKQNGYSDPQLAALLNSDPDAVRSYRKSLGVQPVFKAVDTCAGEFEALTPYYYATYAEENEAPAHDERERVIVLGSGPNRIGQGIEFDYCCVHAVMALEEQGYEAIMINCNPETVSTDYDMVDRLYFEPIVLERVLDIVEQEQPKGVIIQFGGQTPLKLALDLEERGVPVLGTRPSAIHAAEDRKQFDALCERLGVRRPEGATASGLDEAVETAKRIGFPVLVRPSYVLGGRGMAVVWDEVELKGYAVQALAIDPNQPVLIDRYLEGALEVDVDCVADTQGNVEVGGVMQHVEEAGIHSGDSACVLPPQGISETLLDEIRSTAKAFARELGVVGLMNVQFAIRDEQLYTIEVNPRASRTVPFVSKATGIPMAKVATRCMLGLPIDEAGLPSEPRPAHTSVKKVVLPFLRMPGSDLLLGPEMKSTGEVMGIASRFHRAYAKATVAAGDRLPLIGRVFLSLADRDKNQLLEVARRLHRLKFGLVATRGTQRFLKEHGLPADFVYKVKEGSPDVVESIRGGKIDIVINTPLGAESHYDELPIRRASLEHGVPCITNVGAAQALVTAIEGICDAELRVKSVQEHHSESASDRPPSDFDL